MVNVTVALAERLRIARELHDIVVLAKLDLCDHFQAVVVAHESSVVRPGT